VLNLNDWLFYVVSTETIDREFKEQKTAVLSRMKRLCRAVPYRELKECLGFPAFCFAVLILSLRTIKTQQRQRLGVIAISGRCD
jgi:hypothetical protein